MKYVDPDITTEALRASPALTVTGLTVAGVSLDDWVKIITLLFVALQIFFLLRDKWWKKRKDKNGRK